MVRGSRYGQNIVIVFTGGGFEPGDIGGFIVNAIKSDKSLTKNDHAYELLLKKVKDAATPPSPKPLNELPKTAKGINGMEYILGDNTINVLDDNSTDFKRISLFFPNKKEGLLRVVGKNSTLEIPFGLDGIYRISPTGYLGLPRASKGVWQTENKFVLYSYQVSRMDLDEIILTFESNRVVIENDETTVKGEYEKIW